MARVTDLNFYMEDKLKEKLDLCIDRCTKQQLDNLIIIDGDEGIGKSTFAISCAYYVSHKTGRPFSVDNVFFDLNKLFEFARTTKDQIIVWDEAALGGLSTDWRNQLQNTLIKLLMVARKKRHFFFFNIPKFFKLNEYLIVDRSIALVHIYARKEIEQGRFCYYKKSSKEKLFYDRIRTRQRNYKKYYDFHGSFPNILSQVIDEAEYDRKKDEAILSIGVDEKRNTWKLKYDKLITKICKSDLTANEIKEKFGIPTTTTYDRRKKLEIAQEIGETHSTVYGNNYLMGLDEGGVEE